MTRLSPALAALLVLAVSRDALPCAGCRNPSMPTTRGNEGALEEQSVRLGGTLTGTTLRVVHEAGCVDLATCTETPVQPLYEHDQRITPLELRLFAEYGFSDLLGVELQVPFRLVKTTIEYSTPAGAPYEPLDPDVHHRNETVAGPADPWLLLRFSGRVEGTFLAARPGVTLPFGRTEENPYTLGDRGLRHQHVQLGTGTFDPVLALEASRDFGPVTGQVFTQAQAALYENGHAYRAPARLFGGTSWGTKLVGDLRGALGAEVLHETADHWDGAVRQDGNLGRTELLAALSLAQTLDRTTFTLGVRAPFYRHVVVGDEPPGTLDSPLTLSLGVSTVLPLGARGHAHEPSPAPTGETPPARR